MKNGVFCDVTPFYLKTILKNATFCDVKPSGSCRNRRFVGTYRLHHQGDKNPRARSNVSSN
jgi:hypothetical protein